MINHNNAAYNVLCLAQFKQAIGTYVTNFDTRMDTIGCVLHHPDDATWDFAPTCRTGAERRKRGRDRRRDDHARARIAAARVGWCGRRRLACREGDDDREGWCEALHGRWA